MPPAPLVILNPSAGGGRGQRLASWLRASTASWPDAEFAVTTAPGHAFELATAAATDAKKRVVVVGGDGTVHEVVNGLLAAPPDRRPSLGVVAAGSGNDLARSLGLPRAPEAAWSVATGAETAPLDLGMAMGSAGSRCFVSAGGVGFDAQVAAAMSRRRRWRGGALGYLLTTLDELRRFRNRSVRIAIDGSPAEEREILFVAIANGPYYGGAMRICPDARTDDGILDLCVVGDISRLTALRQLPNLYRGTHVTHPAVEMHVASRIRLDGEPDTLVHLDGEPFGTLPLSVEVLPAAIRVARSRDTP